MKTRTLFTPDIEPIKDADFGFGIWPWSRGPMWELLEPWTFEVMNGGFDEVYTIPAGYQFDKASVPSYFWSLGYTPDGLCTVPALEHDFLCDLYAGGSAWLRDVLGAVPVSPPAQVIHRHFYDQLVKWGMRPSKARVMWEGVRNFGPGGYLRPASWFGRKVKG
jgi:hypothetical protein